MSRKRKASSRNDNDHEFDPAPKHLVVSHLKNQEKRLIIILEGAQLESVKVNIRSNSLLNHISYPWGFRKAAEIYR